MTAEIRRADGTREPRSKPSRLELLLFAVIFVAALFMRLYRIDSVPPGVTHDEADTAYFVKAVLEGEPAHVDAPYGWAYEPFTQYSGAVFMWIFGQTDLALRFHAAFFGMVLLVFTYLWARCAFGVPEALGAAALVAVSFWPVANSRFALNPQPAPALFTGAAYFLCLGLKAGRRRRWAWVPFALLLAGSLYVYEAARAASIGLILFLAYLGLFAKPLFRRSGAWFAGALAGAALLAAPHLLDPSSWGRAATQSGPLRSALVGDIGPLLANVASGLGTIFVRGDSFVTYNLPGRPIFGPIGGLFFLVGVGVCLARWRRPAYAFAVLWLVFGLSPTLAVGEYLSTLHSTAAQAPVMAMAAIGAVEGARLVGRRLGERWKGAYVAVCVGAVLVLTAFTVRDYFRTWADSPDTRAAYFSNLVAITDYLEEGDHTGSVVVSSPFPDLPHDPFIADLRLHRDDVAVHWADGRHALLFPQAGSGLLIVPASAPLDPFFVERLDMELQHRVNLRPDDIDPTFDVYSWDSGIALGSDSVGVDGEQVSLPVSFDGAVELTGYEVSSSDAAPGDVVTVATSWRVLEPARLGPVRDDAYGPQAMLFVHMLGPDGEILAQSDRLDAPAWGWRPGDSFVQLHRLELPPDLDEGSHRLALGVYTLGGSPALPASAGPARRVFLPPVRVRVD